MNISRAPTYVLREPCAEKLREKTSGGDEETEKPSCKDDKRK